MTEQRKLVAFARVWNSVITYFYDTHKVSKEELQRLSYKIKGTDPADFLSGSIEKEPGKKSDIAVLINRTSKRTPS